MQCLHLSVAGNFPMTNHAENQRSQGKKKYLVIFNLTSFYQFIMSLFLPENYPIYMKICNPRIKNLFLSGSLASIEAVT